MANMLKKVFNWSEVHLSEVTFYKIHTLAKLQKRAKSVQKQKGTRFRVNVQGVESLGGHFACLCRGFEFYEVKKKIVMIFQKENGNTCTLLIIL